MRDGALHYGLMALLALNATTLLAQGEEIGGLSEMGEQHYQERCATCHDDPEDYVPPRSQLEQRSADYVINALTEGSMYPHAEGLDEEEVKSVAVHVTGELPTGSLINPDWNLNACADAPAAIGENDYHWNGWGRDVANGRYQPEPGFKAHDADKLEVKWSFAYPNGRHNAQPVLVGDQVLVAAAPGRVYSLDMESGCAHWVYDPEAGVRATPSVGPLPDSDRHAVFVGTTDRHVHAMDAQTGERIWKTQLSELAEARVTGAPVLHEDRLYVPLSSFEETAAVSPDYECCRFRGNVVALDVANGEILWRTHAIEEEPREHKVNEKGKPMFGPAGAAIWSAPTLDLERELLFAATGDSYTDVKENGSDAVVAMRMADGEVAWKNQVMEGDNFLVGCFGGGGHANCPEELGPDYDFGSSPILRDTGERTLALTGQKSGILYAMDVDNGGEIVWERKLGEGSALGGIQWGSAADDEVVYVPVTDTAVFQQDLRKPGLTALDIASGETLWHTPAPEARCGDSNNCSNGLSAAVSVMPGAVFAGSLDGMLRAYSTEGGDILWEFDTKREYQTVNGLNVTGGSINATGPTMARGMLFINSGYGGVMNAGGMGGADSPDSEGGQDGNVLVVFSVDGE